MCHSQNDNSYIGTIPGTFLTFPIYILCSRIYVQNICNSIQFEQTSRSVLVPKELQPYMGEMELRTSNAVPRICLSKMKGENESKEEIEPKKGKKGKKKKKSKKMDESEQQINK